MFRSILNRLFDTGRARRTSRSGRARRASRSGRAPQRRLTLQLLEDRAVPASLVTDLPDYAPGTTALISGTGFEVGENVNISLVADNGSSESLSVTDGGANDLDRVADGNFTTTWLCDPNGAYLDATITATASGDLGSSASTTFTDSTGAIFTTLSNGSMVQNANTQYNLRTEVYFEGMNFAEGDYYVRVVQTQGQVTLGTSHGATLRIGSDGLIDNVQLWSLVYASDGTLGYDISANGVYKVEVSANADFSNSKQDNFKVKAIVSLAGEKFEDSNGDGDKDPGENGIAGWEIKVTVGSETATVKTDAEGRYSVSFTVDANDLAADISYSVEEVQQDGWTQTAGDGDIVTAGFQPYTGKFSTKKAAATGLDFGNFKLFSLSDGNATVPGDGSPTNPGGATDPLAPMEPTDSSEPTDSTGPNDPTDEAGPNVPKAPTGPRVPTEPTIPNVQPKSKVQTAATDNDSTVSLSVRVDSSINNLVMDALWAVPNMAMGDELLCLSCAALILDHASLPLHVSSAGVQSGVAASGGMDEDAEVEVQGVVFGDCDANGVWTEDEPRLSGCIVRLVDVAGGVVAETRTGPEGEYRFIDVPAGRYRVEVEGDAGWSGAVSLPFGAASGLVTVDPLGLPLAEDAAGEGALPTDEVAPATEAVDASWALLGAALPILLDRKDRHKDRSASGAARHRAY